MADDDGHLGAYVIHARRRVVHMFWAAAANMRNYRVVQIECRLGSAASAASNNRRMHRGADVPFTATHMGNCICNNWKRNETSSHRQPIQFASIFFSFLTLTKKNMVLLRPVRRINKYYILSFFWSVSTRSAANVLCFFPEAITYNPA